MPEKVDVKKLYSIFGSTIKKALSKKNEIPRDFGELGYEVVANQYTVVSMTRPGYYYVTMRDGTFREVRRGNVLPNPRMPVEIRYYDDNRESDREGYCYGVDESRIKQYSSDPDILSQPSQHSHHRGSGNEFPIDLRMIYQLKASITSGMIVTIQPGFYYTKDGLKWFPGAVVDHTANRPSEVSYKRWCVACINPDDNSIVLTNGTSIPSAQSLLESAIPSIAISNTDLVYLYAVQLFQNRSTMGEMDFVALYHIAQSMNGVDSFKVKVTTNDTTPNFLSSKISGTGFVTVTLLNGGANESLQISVSGVAAAVHVHSAADITSGTLDAARLPTSGVTPGSYTGTDLTVDQYGRITLAANGSGSSSKLLETVRLVTAAALPSVTYANGTAGVGATLTATANGALSVDGVAVANSDRILVKNQASALQNGIYTVTDLGSGGTPFVLTRTADADSSNELLNSVVYARAGTANTNFGFFLTNTAAITLGTDAINYAQIVGGVTSLTGDVTGTGPGATATTIANGAVTTVKIADGAVTAAKIDEDATTLVNDYRLSAANVDDSEADVSASATLYLVGCKGGDRITLHDGTRWLIVTPTSATISGALNFGLSPITLAVTNGSNIVTTSAPYDQRLLCIGMQVSGLLSEFPGVPLITAFTSTTTFTVHINANTTSSGEAANFKLQEDIRFDVFAYLTGTNQDVALHFEQWTNNTTRAFDLAQTNRRWHLDGDETMLYVGSARTRTGSVTVNDTIGQRHLWNYYNQRRRKLLLVSGLNGFNDTNTNIHQYNSSAVQQVEVMIGMPDVSLADLIVHAYNVNTGGMRAGVGYDSTTTFDSGGGNLGRRSLTDAFTTTWERLMDEIGSHVLSMNAAGAASGAWVGQNLNFEAGMIGGIVM